VSTDCLTFNAGLRDSRSIIQARNTLFSLFGGKVPPRRAPTKPGERHYLIARVGVNRGYCSRRRRAVSKVVGGTLWDLSSRANAENSARPMSAVGPILSKNLMGRKPPSMSDNRIIRHVAKYPVLDFAKKQLAPALFAHVLCDVLLRASVEVTVHRPRGG
jgi:hypothetical protein